jgi:predicted phosphodiesterase
MKTTGLFTVRNYKIKVEELGEPIYLIPFGDVHKYAPLHSDDHWQEFLEWARNKKRSYFLGMGDYVDLASTTERNAIKTGQFHDSTIMTLEELYIKHINGMHDDLEFMRGKCVGLLEGNHYAEFRDGTTSTQQLCRLLKTDYLGCSAFIRLSFEYRNKHASLDVWAHHGKGAARLIGGSLNTVQTMGEQAEADIYLMGHDHKKSIGLTSKMKIAQCLGNYTLVQKKQIYARTGSFLRGYVPDKCSYVADACLNPTDLGVVKIEMTPRRLHGESLSIDIHASI